MIIIILRMLKSNKCAQWATKRNAQYLPQTLMGYPRHQLRTNQMYIYQSELPATTFRWNSKGLFGTAVHWWRQLCIQVQTTPFPLVYASAQTLKKLWPVARTSRFGKKMCTGSTVQESVEYLTPTPLHVAEHQQTTSNISSGLFYTDYQALATYILPVFRYS